MDRTGFSVIGGMRRGRWHACWRGVVGAGLAALPGFAAPAADRARIVHWGSGQNYNCALDDGGQLWCQGNKNLGQLGDGTLINPNRPVVVTGLDDAVAITVGDNHNCALRESGRVYCWGMNFHGRLGDGTLTDRLAPVRVRRLGNSSPELAAGGSHICVRRTTGRVVCRGPGEFRPDG